MITTLKITNKKVTKDIITDKFKLIINYDDAHSNTIISTSAVYILEYINLFESYKNKLEENWNEWCNPESQQLIRLAKKYIIHTIPPKGHIEDFISDIWAYSEEYPDVYARYDNFKLTYFNKEGIEFKVKIIKNQIK